MCTPKCFLGLIYVFRQQFLFSYLFSEKGTDLVQIMCFIVLQLKPGFCFKDVSRKCYLWLKLLSAICFPFLQTLSTGCFWCLIHVKFMEKKICFLNYKFLLKKNHKQHSEIKLHFLAISTQCSIKPMIFEDYEIQKL